MANTYPSCPLGDGILEDLNKRKDQKVKYAPDYVNDLVGKMRQLLTNRAADATIYADELANRTAQRAAAQTLVDTVFAREAADIVNLEGVSVGRVEQFHAYWLGERAKLGGLSPDLTYSNAGEVLDDILTARNVAGGIIDIQTKMNGLHAVQEYWKLFKNSMSSKGINDAKTVNDIFRDSVEVGLIPKHNAGLNIGKNGRSFNMERYRAFRIDMYKKGFSSDEFDNLMDSAYKIGGSMDDVRIMVNKLGANVGEVEGLGYLPRMWTHDMKKWVDKARSLKEGSLFETADAAREWAFKESRSTYHYVPEDNLLVAYQLDIPVSQLNDMLGDGTFVQWLHQNVTSKEGGQQLLENMLDQGTMSKLPMTTREVMTYLTDNLELPFKVADKSFIDDPMEMVNRYTEVLKEAAQDAAVSKLIVTEGLDHGWAVLPKNYKPEIHTDFVKVSADDVRTAFSDWKGGDIWMRKVVFNNWKATLEMVQNPNLMGHFGNVMNHVTNFFNKAVLLQSGVGYPVKVFADSIRAFNTAGGNMLRMWEGFHDINRVFSKGTAALENTKAVYGIGFKDGLTERGAFEKFIMHRQFDLSPNTPGIKSGGKFPTIKNLAKDGKALFEGAAGGVQYAFHYANAFGWDAFPDIAKMPFSSVDKVQKEAFSYLATMANYAEMTTKWALIKSLTDGSDTGKIFAGTAQLLGGIPEFKSWDEVYRYVDDNFFNWQTSGVLPKYASIVKPFAVFSMKSTPAALRMAMRRPQAFVNYMRLRSFMTQQATEDDPNLNQGTVPDWLLETSPIFLFNDKATGQYGALLSGSWNAFEDSWNFMGHGLPQMIDDLTGQDTGSVEHRRDLMKQDRAGAGGRLQQFVKDMVSQSTAPIENLMSLVMNEDLKTGKPIVSTDSGNLFGFTVPTFVEKIFSMYPPLQALNKSQVLDPITGTPEIRDSTGRIIQEGTPGIGGARRISFRKEEYTPGTYKTMVKVANAMGFNIKIMDTAKNYQWNWSEAKQNLNEATKAANDAKHDIIKMQIRHGEIEKYPEEYKANMERYNEMQTQSAQANYDFIVLTELMRRRKIAPKELYNMSEDMVNRQIAKLYQDPIAAEYLNKQQSIILENMGKNLDLK